jgi:hypothetical protein
MTCEADERAGERLSSARPVNVKSLIARTWLVVGGVLLVAVVGGLFLAWAPSGPTEPVYDGKPLDYWLTNITMAPRQGTGVVTVWGGSKGEPEIVRGVIDDPNAVAFLIRKLKRDSWFGAAYYRKWLWPKLPAILRRQLPPPSAGNAGSRANPALLLGMKHEEQRILLALVGALRGDDKPGVKWNAAWALGNLGNRDTAAVEALTAALKDNDATVRSESTNALLKLDPNAAAKAGVKPPAPAL